MIEKLRGMAIFATVVEQGSFRGAARHLGLAPSRISQTVSNLEKDLGVTLLYRSTRQLSLSNEGRILFAKVTEMLEAAENGLDAISPLSEEPAGELRVTAPAFLTQTEFMDALAGFAHAFPHVLLKLTFTDRVSNMIKDGFDVSIRAGWLEDTEFLARKISQIDRVLVASPEYLASKPAPSHPTELEQWDWVRFEMRPDRTDMTHANGEKASVVGKSQVSVDAADALYEFAVRGLGLTEIPEHLAKRGFDRGELVHVLPEWSLRALGLHAVWPDASRRASLTLMFVRFLAEQHEN